LLWLLSVLASGSVFAQQASSIPVPTPEQLEVLQTLSEDERAGLLEQLGMQRGSSEESRTDTRAEGAAATNDGLGSRDSALSGVSREFAERAELEGGDTVLIDISVKGPRYILEQPGNPASRIVPDPSFVPLDGTRRQQVETIIQQILAGNPYQLDRDGALQLPGFRPVPLLGLDEKQATKRLSADPSLADASVAVTRLPLRQVGAEALQPFGYDMFRSPSFRAAGAQQVPVPADYVVGPGDEFNVQLYGSQNRSLRLVVSRDGRINFPDLGPISVVGKRFNTVRQEIESRVAREMIGVRASVSLGDARGITIFVLGEVAVPGTHTVSGLSTITSALFAAGGVSRIGSLRDVQLKRQGAVVRRLDLYDLLLRGDTSDDAKLLPGDVVFVPAVGATVSITGAVRRPAIYELKDMVAAADLVQMAGGLSADGDATRGSLGRIDAARRRVVVDVDLTTSAGRSLALRNGDALTIPRVLPTLDAGITVTGHVHSPIQVAYRPGMRLSSVIRSVDELKPDADTGYLLIRRESPQDRELSVVSADLLAALRDVGGAADIELAPRDQITVFDLSSSRDRVIQPLVREIRQQGRLDKPTQLVRVMGRVRIEGEYPLEPGMRLSDLLRAGGGLADAAFGGEAELTRYAVTSDGARRAELLRIDLAALRNKDANADLELQPFDLVTVKEVTAWADADEVTINGEVKFPGTYRITRGETLASVLQRAGGITDLAFPEGAVFLREDLRKREQEQLDVLAGRLQNDLATLALQGAAANQAQAGTALQVGQSLLAQLRDTKGVGRLVINFSRVLAADPGSVNDIVLRSGDRLLIPRRRQEVTVIGEVQSSTSHFFRTDLDRDDYISLSGGTTRKADRDRTYVVRADGSVVASESSRWFSRASQVPIHPGDTIVVPLDTERLPALPLWQAVTQILYNVAVSVAAVNSF
jgi:protein involved in polysaccharide export with SLBB domain